MVFVSNKIDNPEKTGAREFFRGRLCAATLIALSIFLLGCQKRSQLLVSPLSRWGLMLGKRS
jgi:hypothetical protein